MSNAFAGVGATFERQDDTSSTVYAAIAEVNSINFDGMKSEMIDVTSLDSTGGYREFKRGFRDGGTVTLEMNFTFAGYEQMRVDFETDTSVNYRIVLPDTTATTFDFAAFVQDAPFSVVPDDKVTATVNLKITGQVTITT